MTGFKKGDVPEPAERVDTSLRKGTYPIAIPSLPSLLLHSEPFPGRIQGRA